MLLFQKIGGALDPSKSCSRLSKTWFFEKRAADFWRKIEESHVGKAACAGAFGFILGGQKSSKILTFWKHENVDFVLYFTCFAAHWGRQKRENMRANKYEKMGKSGAEKAGDFWRKIEKKRSALAGCAEPVKA